MLQLHESKVPLRNLEVFQKCDRFGNLKIAFFLSFFPFFLKKKSTSFNPNFDRRWKISGIFQCFVQKVVLSKQNFELRLLRADVFPRLQLQGPHFGGQRSVHFTWVNKSPVLQALLPKLPKLRSTSTLCATSTHSLLLQFPSSRSFQTVFTSYTLLPPPPAKGAKNKSMKLSRLCPPRLLKLCSGRRRKRSVYSARRL